MEIAQLFTWYVPAILISNAVRYNVPPEVLQQWKL